MRNRSTVCCLFWKMDLAKPTVLPVLQVTQFEFPSSQEVPSAPKKRKFSEPKERYWAPRLLTTSSAVFTFTLLLKNVLFTGSDHSNAMCLRIIWPVYHLVQLFKIFWNVGYITHFLSTKENTILCLFVKLFTLGKLAYWGLGVYTHL